MKLPRFREPLPQGGGPEPGALVLRADKGEKPGGRRPRRVEGDGGRPVNFQKNFLQPLPFWESYVYNVM